MCLLTFTVILRRRTPVCQFASPLDVDIHSNPQVMISKGSHVTLNYLKLENPLAK